MLDSALQAYIQSTLVAGLASRGVAAGVAQNNQPRQFTAPSTPYVFYSMAPRKPWGWPKRKDVVNDDGTITTTKTQVVHTQFQIAGFAPNPSPSTPYALTSGDLAGIAWSIFTDEATLESFVDAGFNIFRVDRIDTLPFQDSNGQNVYWSSFDIIFTHKDVTTTSTGVITVFNPNIESL